MTWYRSVGPDDGDAIPLLCLHGGPGANWLHVKPYEVLADERRVVFYDQLGSGNSAVEEPHDPSMWTPELYVEVDRGPMELPPVQSRVRGAPPE